jgi:hypothetical protein
MAIPRHAASLWILSSLLSSEVLAEMLLELPQDESPAAWEPVLQSVGLSAGAAERAPWARLVVQGDACELQVATSWGSVLSEPVPCPVTASDREEVACLAAVMLEPMVRGERSLANLPSVGPAEVAEPVPGGKLRLAAPSVGSSESSDPDVSSPEPTRFVVPLGSGERQLADGSAELASVDQPSSTLGAAGGPQLDERLGSPRAVTGIPRNEGTKLDSIQCNYTGCAAVVDRYRCGEADGCSTAEKCPDTWWQDLDLDGFGSRVCLDLQGSPSIGKWVQNVGDCDDRHSSVHPGADERMDDGIDNNCDGVTR